MYAVHFTVYHTHTQHINTSSPEITGTRRRDLFVLLVQWAEAVVAVTV